MNKHSVVSGPRQVSKTSPALHHRLAWVRVWSRFFTCCFFLFCSITASIGQQQTQAPAVRGGEEESGDEILARERFFYTRRAGGPGKTIPDDAYAKAVAQAMPLLSKDRTGSRAISATVPSWVSVNPSGMFYQRTGSNYISGRTNSIASHPAHPNTLYIGAAGGGVWKTTNGGASWAPLTDHLTALTCGAVAVDPNDSNVVYFGTGELNYSLDSYYGDGVFKSTDGGTSWTKIATTSVGRYISQIVIDPTNSNNVYLSGSYGVYRSADAGLNWGITGSGSNANCLLLDPTNPQILYTTKGGTSTNSIRKSTDGGGSWVTLTNGLPTASMGRTQLAMAPSNTSIIYASISNRSTDNLLGIYRTTDGGSSWTLQSSATNYLGSQGWYDNAITVSPTNPDIIFVGGLDIYGSTDAGVSLAQKTVWYTTSSMNMSHADIHFLGFVGSTLYCGSDGGVYKSTNSGVAWSDLNATLSTLQYQSADYDPTNTQRLYGGTQDNNLETSTNGGGLWIQRTTGDGGYSIVDPVSPNIVYGQYVGGSLKRSTDYAVSFTEISPSGSSGGLFYNPYEIAPGDHNTIVFGRGDIWKTTSASTATSSSGWTQIRGTIGGNVSAIGISSYDTYKIYIGTDNGRILITTDGGASWTDKSGFPYISDLAVDEDDAVCYASCGGFGSTHIYKTTNSGSTWTNISGNYPNIPVNSIVLRTTSPRMIFIGTDVGVYRSTDDGTT
ncbi:MAG: hypothetical protein HY277_08630, partial [Ignavibacteriales bacterium]|nr:hypothetical protein [Ignavibacteriales bacterium]